MRKAFRLTVVLAIVIAFGIAGAVSVNASAPSSARSGHTDGFGTLKAPAAPQQITDQEYMPNSALVMFRTTKKLSSSAAKKTLRGGEAGVADLQIEEMWNFDGEDATVTSSSGVRKVLKGAGKTYSGIALVHSKTLSTEQLVKVMNSRDDVLYAEPNYRIHAYSVNDPYFSSQWSMQGGAEGTPEYSEVTPNVSALWDQGTTGSDRIVAVVDTGVDYKHPDLKDMMWENTHYPTLKGDCGYDFNAGDDNPMDENGHGTHCAGIIGAQGNNGIGTSGVNQQIRIMALRILDADGSAYLSHEIAAYNYINKALDLGEPVQAINNSWGGGEYSHIFEKLVDIVGKKGAITVCAAGNEANDNDEYEDYPSCIESPYLISVAATKEDGDLVSFSNYGKETVDIAAPGTDILSSVAYNCYNPGIYGEEQASLSAEYNDYESDASDLWGSPEMLTSSLMFNGEAYTGGADQPQITISKGAGNGFMSDGVLELNVKKIKTGDLICIPLPYEIAKDAKTAPGYSVMGQVYGSTDEIGIMGLMDVPQGTSLDIGTIGDVYLSAGNYIFKDEPDYWDHFSFTTLSADELKDVKAKAARAEQSGETLDPDPLKREVVLLLYAYSDGDMTLRLDNMGLSRQDIAEKDFGKYDFMSGTSMATPYVAGTVALKAASLGEFGSEDPATLANEVISMVKEGTMPIIQKGSLDFTKAPVELGPRFGKVKVKKAGQNIVITGSGLNPSTPLRVEIGPDEKNLQDAEIISQTDGEVVVKDNGWVNNVETVRITGFNGRTVYKSDQYLVNGKGEFDELKGVENEFEGEPMTTDGKYIYSVSSSAKCAMKMNTQKLNRGVSYFGEIKTKKIFGKKKDKNATYALNFGKDLAYMNGKLYTVIEYGPADEAEEEMDEFWFFSKDGSHVIRSSDDYDEDYSYGNMSIYSGEYRLISIDTKSGKVQNLGKLPTDLLKKVDYTMAAYNGKLYFMGGYSYQSKSLTNTVKVFDPAKKKNKRWSKGANLPQPRAGGKALQSGSKLIYTLGYAVPQDPENEEADFIFPANMTFNGKKWTASKIADDQGLEPLLIEDTVYRGGETYSVFTSTVSAVKNGLLYTGMPVANYGDTFRYNAAKDRFEDTGYNYIRDLDEIEIDGIAVGSKVYGFDSETVYTAKATGGSALVKVAVKKSGKGTVKGAGSFVPGTDAKITVKAAKGHKIKSIKVGAKKVVVKRNATKKTFTIKKLLKDQKVKVVFR